jgi:hypothetical protein
MSNTSLFKSYNKQSKNLLQLVFPRDLFFQSQKTLIPSSTDIKIPIYYKKITNSFKIGI